MKDKLTLLQTIGYGRVSSTQLSRHVSPLDILEGEHAGLLHRDHNNYLSLTPSGKALLHQLEKQAQQQARANSQQQRSYRHSWWQFFLGVFLGWLLGGFTPQQVWQFFHQLFLSLFH